MTHIRRGACPTTHKRMFVTRADAKHNITTNHLKDVTAFKCADCKYFHVGGWHGVKDRAAHRGETIPDTMTITEACRRLDVSPQFLGRLIDAGRITTYNGNPATTDIERIEKI